MAAHFRLAGLGRKPDRLKILRAYRTHTGRGLLSVVAERTGKDPTVVSRTFHRHIVRRPDPEVVAMLEAEIARILNAGVSSASMHHFGRFVNGEIKGVVPVP